MPYWAMGSDGAVARSHYEINVPMSDPRFAEVLNFDGTPTAAGIPVNERTALGSTAVFRAVSILANTIAGLPLKSYKTDDTGTRLEIKSILDDPAKQWYTPFEWMQIVMVHLALHGNAYLLHVYGGGGQLVALFPIHPDMVRVTWKRGEDGQAYRNYSVVFNTTNPDGTPSAEQKINYTNADLTHIMGLSTDGLRGVSPLRVGRDAIGTGLAGDRAAARVFSNGLLLGGIVAVDGVNADQRAAIAADLNNRLAGSANAGKVAVVNAALTFSPWQMNAEDAQFIESRQFQVEEVARMWGIPKVLLAQDGASTWGSGIAELDKGLAKYTFVGYTRAIEDKLSELLYGSARHVEFEYDGLYRGTPDEETAQLILQVTGGLLTVDEARAIMNLPPLSPKGDENPALDKALALIQNAPTLLKDPGLASLVADLQAAMNGEAMPITVAPAPQPVAPKADTSTVVPLPPGASPPSPANPTQ